MTTPYSKYYDEVEARAKHVAFPMKDCTACEGTGWITDPIRCHHESYEHPDVPALVARCRELTRALESLLNRVNAVTAPHRHGSPVPAQRLTDLANRQLDVEAILGADPTKEGK